MPAYTGTVTDNCPGPYSQSQSPSAGTILTGATIITLTATDAHTNTNTCSFTVTPNDITPPNITCPGNIVKNNAPGLCGANVSYPTPTATDNCGIATVVLMSGLASGAYYPVGVTTNVWKATDLAGNTATCSFTVRVEDTQPPSANCPPDRSVNNDHGECFASLNIAGGLAVNDNCGIAGSSNNAPAAFPVGETVVTWTVLDHSGNAGTCTFRVTVRDAESPTVQCPGSIHTLTDLDDCAATVNFNVTANDNCGVANTELSEPSGSAFPIGYSNIQFSAWDSEGNVASCFFQVIVNTRPEICNDFDDDCDGWVDEAEDWSALVKRYASDGVAAEEYGLSVDMDGDYAIIGSNQKNATGQSVGSAYILFRDKNGDNDWGQVIELLAPGLMPGDNFGASVAISGGIAAVGAPLDDALLNDEGAVHLFYQNGNNPEQWDFVKTVVAGDANATDNFGTSVALDGNDYWLAQNSMTKRQTMLERLMSFTATSVEPTTGGKAQNYLPLLGLLTTTWGLVWTLTEIMQSWVQVAWMVCFKMWVRLTFLAATNLAQTPGGRLPGSAQASLLAMTISVHQWVSAVRGPS